MIIARGISSKSSGPSRLHGTVRESYKIRVRGAIVVVSKHARARHLADHIIDPISASPASCLNFVVAGILGLLKAATTEVAVTAFLTSYIDR